MRLDYTVKDPVSRKRHVESELSKGCPSASDLTHMADYLLFATDKGTTKREKDMEYPIVTPNRETTISKRQVSYDEISDACDHMGDLAFLSASTNEGKILDPKDPITERDMAEIPGLRQKVQQVEDLKRQIETAHGRRKYMLKQQLIATYKEQYTLKFTHKGNMRRKVPNPVSLFSSFAVPDESVYIDESGFPHATPGCPSFLDYETVAAFLSSYMKVMSDQSCSMDSEARLMAMDLERLMKIALPPLLYDVAVFKMCGYSNVDIAAKIQEKYGVSHFHRYYSTLWTTRIPKLIARKAQEEYILKHHDEMGFSEYKVCPKCGRAKLAHPMFFSKNTCNDGYYSICKACRAK